MFRTGHRAPRLVARVRSRGVAPTSIAEHRGRVYVLNSGGTPNVAAFWRRFDGSLAPIPGGTRELARGALGAAQVSVTPDGRSLVVSERLANRLETLPLDFLGRPGAPVVTASSGTVPFGFAISPQGTIVVSEAGLSTVSSYRAGAHGALHNITASLRATWTSTCAAGAARRESERPGHGLPRRLRRVTDARRHRPRGRGDHGRRRAVTNGPRTGLRGHER